MKNNLHLHWDGESNIWFLKHRQKPDIRLRDFESDPYFSFSGTHLRLLLTWNDGAYARTHREDELDEANKEDVDGFDRLIQTYRPFRVDVDGDAFLDNILPFWMHLAFIHAVRILGYSNIYPVHFEPSFSIECLRLQKYPSPISMLPELISCQYLHLHDVRTSSDLNFLAVWLKDSRPARELRCLSVRLSNPFPYEEAIDRVWSTLGGSRVFEALEYLEMKKNINSTIDKALFNCPRLIGLVLIDPWGASLDGLLRFCSESNLNQLCMVDFTTDRNPHYGPAIYETFANGARKATVSYLASDLFDPVLLLRALQQNKINFYQHSILEHIQTDREHNDFQLFLFRKRCFLRDWKKLCFWIAWCRANGSHTFCLSGLPLTNLILEFSSAFQSFVPLMFPHVHQKKKNQSKRKRIKENE